MGNVFLWIGRGGSKVRNKESFFSYLLLVVNWESRVRYGVELFGVYFMG